jgi:hypothetical protein
MMILVLFFTCNVFLFGLHCTDHGPQTKKLSVRYLDNLMILVAIKMMQEVSSIGMAKWKFGSGYQITWRLTCACCQSWSSTSYCCSHGLNTIQSHAPVQSSARSTTIWKTKQTHTHTQKPAWRINPSCNICVTSKFWWCMQLMRTIAMVAALVQELLLYTFDGSLLCWACYNSSAITAYSQIRSIDILVKLEFSERR